MTINIRLSARLRAARKAAVFKTSKAFLKKYNIPASTYSQHESGSRLADDKTLKFYSKTFDVNFDWLKTGNGQPFLKPTLTKSTTLKEELIDLSGFKNNKIASSIEVDQKLLAKILEKMIVLHLPEKTKLSFSAIARSAVQLYVKIINENGNEKIQLHKVKNMLNSNKNLRTYKKTSVKSN